MCPGSRFSIPHDPAVGGDFEAAGYAATSSSRQSHRGRACCLPTTFMRLDDVWATQIASDADVHGGRVLLAVQLAHEVTQVQAYDAIEIGKRLELATGFDVRLDFEPM